MVKTKKNLNFLVKTGVMILVLAGIAYAVFTYMYIDRKDENLPAPPTPLELAGDACLTIAENAVAKINAVVEFQQLEKQSRKLHVFETCMHDRSYIENPAWLKYAEPLARKTSEDKQFSVDEVLTAMSREQMLQLKPESDKPIYWINGK
ncbi:MAG: hypothetical protein ACAH07_07215 [Methylophilaceae bacterium]|nr:hypothetical protein [Methyloradius sp.]